MPISPPCRFRTEVRWIPYNCCNQAISLIDACRDGSALIRQLDSIRVIPVPFVLFDKNPFEPVRLARSGCLVHEGEIMKHDELLTASITPKGAHLHEIRRSLPRLTLLDRHCLHRLT